MRFGDKIKELREKNHVTQEDLAQALNISVRTLSRYERHAALPKQRDVYLKLASYFRKDVNYFLTEDEEFLSEAAERFGNRGLSQARAVMEQAAALFAGGELSDDDKLAFLHEMQQLYLDSKERARNKFTPKKYRDDSAL